MSDKNDSLGDRMKSYENSFKFNFPNRLPVIVRVDGKAFHTYTKECKKPFDENLIGAMNATAKYLCMHMQGALAAYVQSDEISILLYPWADVNSQAWFDNEIVKIVSVSAGLASGCFTALSHHIFNEIRVATFDSRAFVIPEHDINNYFIWRQQDWERNSLQLLAREHFSHKELLNKGKEDLHEMLHTKGVNWNDLPTHFKRGRTIIKEATVVNGVERMQWTVDNEMPILTQDRAYIVKRLPHYEPTPNS